MFFCLFLLSVSLKAPLVGWDRKPQLRWRTPGYNFTAFYLSLCHTPICGWNLTLQFITETPKEEKNNDLMMLTNMLKISASILFRIPLRAWVFIAQHCKGLLYCQGMKPSNGIWQNDLWNCSFWDPDEEQFKAFIHQGTLTFVSTATWNIKYTSFTERIQYFCHLECCNLTQRWKCQRCSMKSVYIICEQIG